MTKLTTASYVKITLIIVLGLLILGSVSYTHLTLPTKLEV